jgi:hypothetical protein
MLYYWALHPALNSLTFAGVHQPLDGTGKPEPILQATETAEDLW